MEAAGAQFGANPPGAFGEILPPPSTAINPEAATITLSPARRLMPVSVHGTLAGTRTAIAPGEIGPTVDGVFGAGRADAAGSWATRAWASRLPPAAAL